VTATPAGLYVHVPFCLTRCGYCDFNAHAGLEHLKSPFVEALMREADLASPGWDGVPFVSVFLGGGTPTTLAPETIGAILAHLRERFAIADGAEVTCEANPDTVDEAYLVALRAGGVNRLSMGLQSFDPEVLAALERLHSAESAVRAFHAARAAGFDDVNLDLIYGARGESLESWERTLDRAIELRPDHLSCYALTIEPGTPLGRRVSLGATLPPDPDLQAAMFEAACERLARAGYEHYEVSNWSLPGRECVHNLGYWQDRPYLGLGPGAHSFRDGRRWWNLRPPGTYIETLAEGRPPTGGEEVPDAEERRLEQLLPGLRLAEGVPTAWLPEGVAEEFAGRGLARVDGDRFTLTEPGMLLANEVVLAAAGR